MRGFLRSKCIVLVTHQLQIISEAEQLVLLKDGLAAIKASSEILWTGCLHGRSSAICSPTTRAAIRRLVQPDQIKNKLDHTGG